jgi:8-oxo-dGTP pyrophosphatase MutT (NUDIX family)
MTADDPEANPWRTLSSSLPYANRWIELRHHEIVTPAGTPGIYGVVHFHNLAVGVLPIDDEGYTWLVGQYRFPLGRYSWEIPEGGSAIGIDPLLGAQRELREETGIEAREWRLLLELDLSNSVTDEHALLYLATGLSYGESSPDETESLALRRLPFDEVYAMVLDGRITDAMAVCAILRYKLLRDEAR